MREKEMEDIIVLSSLFLYKGGPFPPSPFFFLPPAREERSNGSIKKAPLQRYSFLPFLPIRNPFFPFLFFHSPPSAGFLLFFFLCQDEPKKL